MKHFTISELQKLAATGNEKALIELGRKVLDFDFCLFDEHKRYCAHATELYELKESLENEMPPECPQCGMFLTDN